MIQQDSLLDKFANKLQVIMPNDLIEIYRLSFHSSVQPLIFNTSQIGSHWLLKANYFLLRPDELNTKQRGSCFIEDVFVPEGTNILEKTNEKISQSIREHWSEQKSFAFAWSNDVVEKDTALAYLFNPDGTSKGIYVHSLNFVEHKLYLGETLSELFDLESNIDTKNGIFTPRNLAGQDELTSYESILKKSQIVIDSECIDQTRDYQRIFEIFVGISGNKFNPSQISINGDVFTGVAKIEFAERTYEFEINCDTGYLDLDIIRFLNHCLSNEGFMRKRFLAFYHTSFGQEIGLAFASKSELSRLRTLSSIEILHS